MALKRAYTEGKATELVANCDGYPIILEQQLANKGYIAPLNITIRGLQLSCSTI